MIQLCNCKINLGLYITARRPDGYHEIVTVMLPVSWGDIVEVTRINSRMEVGPTPDRHTQPTPPCPAIPSRGSLTTSGNPVNCPPEKNLVMKAYRALADEVELPPLALHLHKNVPDGAGLGGGSSDAAHTLLAINRECDLGLSTSQLQAIASSIGADCPFFITSRPALCTGIGTTLTELTDGWKSGRPRLDTSSAGCKSTPPRVDTSKRCRGEGAPTSILSLLIVKPPCSVSTKEAYAGVTPKPIDFDLTEAIRQPITTWRDTIHNQFEDSVFPLLPILGEIKSEMYQMGAVYASMSGSGSAMYAIFPGDVPPLPPKWLAKGWHHHIGQFHLPWD